MWRSLPLFLLLILSGRGGRAESKPDADPQLVLANPILPTVSPAIALVPTPAGPVGPAVVPPPPTPTSLTLAGETVVVEKSPVNVQGCNHAHVTFRSGAGTRFIYVVIVKIH